MARWAATWLLALVLLAGGCGGDDDEGGGAGGAESGPDQLTVGVIPIVPVAPVFIAQERGFFEEENLKVETQMAQGGAAIIPAVQSGDFDIGFSNVASLFIARSQGLPVRVVTGGEVTPPGGGEDASAIMVRKDSPIRTPQDLEGKKVGVNTLKNIAGLTTLAAMETEGAAPEIKEVEVPFPEMLPAVQKGSVEAGFFNEPFTTLAKAEGMRSILRPYDVTGDDLPIAPYFAMDEFVAENGDVIERFQRAMEQATDVYRDDPDEARRIVLTYSEIPKAVAERMVMPPVNSELDPGAFEQMADLAQKHGLTEEKADVSQLLPEGAGG
jgi:NitT/TauT family transport system substrate-binding protein